MNRTVIFLDETAEIGGAEVNILMLAPRLAALGWQPRVLLPGPGPLAERLRALHIPVDYLPRPPLFSSSFYLGQRRKVANPLALLANMLIGLIWVFRLARFLRRSRPAVVQTVSMWAHAFGGLAARLAGCPVIWHFQGVVAPRAGLGLYRALLRLCARSIPQRIICISDLVAAQFGDDARLAAKLDLLWNSIDLEQFAQRDGQSSAAPACFTIGTAARLTPWKGQEVALRAAHELKHLGIPFRWRFAGEETLGSSGYRAHLLQLIQSLGLEDRIELVGWLGDMPGFYRSLDVLVHVPLQPEPFGLVLGEALAAGLPIVASSGGADHILRSAGAAFVPAGDSAAVARQLAALYTSPAERAQLGARARQVAERSFGAQRYAEQWSQVYWRVLPGARPSLPDVV